MWLNDQTFSQEIKSALHLPDGLMLVISLCMTQHLVTPFLWGQKQFANKKESANNIMCLKEWFMK